MTEVLENKVDRMWVSNAFLEWAQVKSSTSEGRRQCCSSFLRILTLSVICDNMLNVTHCNKPTSLCCYSTNHAVNCKKPTDLTRCDPHEYYQVVVLCHTEQQAMHGLLQQIMFNIQPVLNICKWTKSNTFWNINSYCLIEQYVTRKIWWFFFPSDLI